MGAALSVSNASVVNKAVVNTYQSAENVCTADCSQIISGVDIILEGSTTGDITFQQKCTANASCSMTNALENVVTEFQKATATADSQTPILPIGFQINVSSSSTENDIRNELKQVLENQCNANIDQVTEDIMIWAKNSTTGDIGFIQNGNASANCVMDNAGRMQLSMQQVGEATATSGNLFGGIIALIIIVVIILAIIKGFGTKDQCKGPDGQPNPNAPAQCQAPPSSTTTTPTTSSTTTTAQTGRQQWSRGQMGAGRQYAQTGRKM